MANLEVLERFPLQHPRRVELHDLKLWRREKRRAVSQRLEKMRCPCTRCKGNKLILINNVERHLVKNGRMPLCRWWKDSAFEWDESDDEWSAYFEGEVDGIRPAVGHDNVDTPIESHDNVNQHQEVNSAPLLDTVDRDDDRPDIDVNRMLSEMFRDLDASRSRQAASEANSEFPPSSDYVVPTAEDIADLDVLERNELSLREACRPLYDGARMSVLAFSMMLLNISNQHAVPNIAVDEILALLQQKAFPEGNLVPAKHYHAKRLVARLGLNYVSIHACNQGCILYRGQFAELVNCPKCGASRYVDSSKRDLPVKVLRHFPIIPRLLRMYRAKSMSELMKWAAQNKSKDGLVRHTGDSLAWKHIDSKYADFAAEERNLRFGIALDGVNPYSDKSTSWSTWPVVLVNYNLPPWLCMKKFFLQLALLIPGKESVTGENLDVYLAPMVEELQRLWVGVSAFDASSPVDNQNFRLRGMLLWSINDYPALGTLSGRSSKGVLSCVVCGPRVTSDFSKTLHKPVFLGHRKWLPEDHPYREACFGHHFNNLAERDSAPPRVTSAEILEWASLKEEYDAAGGRAGQPTDPYKKFGVKRRSVLFDLPYWEHLLIRETLDVMHTEKNVADHLLKTIFGLNDEPKIRRDLQDRNIRSHLWLTPHPTRRGIWVKPLAPWVLTKPEQKLFRRRLEALIVPSGYCGRLKKHILEKKIGHMKSHDFHVFMQQILPVCIRGMMKPEVRSVIMRLSRIFRKLCVKVWDPNDLPNLKEEAAVTLVLLEMHFAPSFFNNMTHLIIHLVEELGICGPVSCRWMYPIERYLSIMKRYVRNRARPEGCMSECYLQDEAVGFATEYMANFDPVRTRIWDDKEDLGFLGEMVEGAGRTVKLSTRLRDIAHRYVLMNMECMAPWVKKWEESQANISMDAGSSSDERDREPISDWLQKYMKNRSSEEVVEAKVLALSFPLKHKCKAYKGMRAYGNHFRVLDNPEPGSERNRYKTYDSGIASLFLVPGEGTTSTVYEFSYVGKLLNILQLDYGLADEDPLLFQGHWVRRDFDSVAASMQFDDSGFLLVNFKRMLPDTREPFVMPSQVEQVFFAATDLDDPDGWNVVLRKEARSRRVLDGSADMLRENRVFAALEAPAVLPTERPVVSIEDGELFTTEDLIRASTGGDLPPASGTEGTGSAYASTSRDSAAPRAARVSERPAFTGTSSESSYDTEETSDDEWVDG